MKKLLVFLLAAFTAAVLFPAWSLAYGQEIENPDIKIVIDGKKENYSNPPIVINGRTLLPLREMLIKLGVQNDGEHILWDGSEKSVTVVKDPGRLFLKINDTAAKINDKTVTLEAAPVIYKDMTYIPARFVAESFGRKVAWDGGTQTVIIGAEADYDQVKGIMENADKKMISLNKYKLSQQIEIDAAYLGQKLSMEINNVFSIDQVRKACSGSWSSTDFFSTPENKLELDMWMDSSGVYYKDKKSGSWRQQDITEEELELERKKTFDAYYFLRQDEALLAGIREVASGEAGEILLKGEVIPREFLNSVKGSGDMKSIWADVKLSSYATEIRIDRSSGAIKNVRIEISAAGGSKDPVGFDMVCLWSNSDLNGSFQVSTPKDLDIVGKAAAEVTAGNNRMKLGDYEEAVASYDRAISINPRYADAYAGKAAALYYLGEFEESLNVLGRYMELEPKDENGLVLEAKIRVEFGEYAEAVELCDKAVQINPKNDMAYNTKALALKYDDRYKEALAAVNMAVILNLQNEEACLNKVSILYHMGNYTECINFAQKAKALFPKNEELPWFQGDCYTALAQYEDAIRCYEEVARINPGNDSAMASIGWEYYNLQNYQKAEEYADKALKINAVNGSAEDLKEYIKEARLPDSTRIFNFIKGNYLYLDKVSDFDGKSKQFLTKENVSVQDVADYLNDIKLKDDIYSFIISGEEYDRYMDVEGSSSIASKILDANNCYIRLYSFTPAVGDEFKGFVDTIKDTESKNLIIDLRDNGGGLTGPSNQILDYLLPECSTSFTVDRNGYIYSYYSDEAQVKFKRIFVLVNGNTASSSELLALGLKKYLNNVTIVGRPTVGKGVCQYAYEDRSKKYILFLVSSYWNVKEQNISGSRIMPDIEVTGTDDKAYFDAVYKLQ